MNLIEIIKKQEISINDRLKDNNVVVKILENAQNSNNGRINILRNNKIDKNFEFEAITAFQINIYEGHKKIEGGLSIQDLEKWLFNLYNPVEYLYTFFGGKLANKILSKSEVYKMSHGFTPDFTEDRKKDLCVHRKELDNQPLVEGYLGPMYDGFDYGKVYIRYETQEIYNMVST